MPEEKRQATENVLAATKPIFSWESPEDDYREKGGTWFTILGLIALVIAAVFYWQKLYSGALVVIAAAFALGAMARTKPRNIKAAMYPDGIIVSGRAYRYNQFKSFGIINGEVPKVKFDLIGKYTGEVIVPLKNVDVGQAKLYLKKHLPENEEVSEDWTDWFNRLIRF